MNRLIESAVFGERKALQVGPVSEPTPGLLGVSGRGHAGRLSGRDASRYSQAYGGTDAIDWVMDAVDLYAQTASNAAFHFERDGKPLANRRNEDTEKYVREAPQDLVNLFERPNPFMDYTELLELAVIDLLLAGEFMWLKFRPNEEGKPLALYRLPPALVDVIPGDSFIDRYVYTPPGGGRPMDFRPQDVLHVKRPNPHNAHRGLSVIAGGPRVYDLELAATDQMANYFETGTRLSGVLESDRSVHESTWTKITRQFQNLYSGRRNAGAVAALERGLRFRPISGTAAEADFARISAWSRDRIAAAFRVPLPLMGDISSADRQAVREAQRIFDNKVMRPFLNRIQKQVTFGLVQAWGLDYVIEHEYVMPIEDKLDLAKSFGELPGVKVKEVREQVDLEPLGDDRDEIVLNLPGEPTNTPDGFADPQNPEGGRPPAGTSTRAFPEPGAALPAGARARKAPATPPRDSAKALTEIMDDLMTQVGGD